MQEVGLKVMAQGSLWIVEILVGVGILGVANLGLKRLIKFISKRYAKNSYDWRGKLNYILYTPINLLIWLMAFAYVLDIVGHRFGFSAALNYLSTFRSASIVSCAAWALLRWKKQLQKDWIARSQMGQRAIDPGMGHVLGRLTSIAIGVIATLIVLQILGLDIVPLLAFGGVGAAAIGFAAREVIANFFGGLMLHITRPFVVGDHILIPEKNIQGVAEEIGWYLTTIRDGDKRPVFLPNALFSSLLIANLSRMTHRKFAETFSIKDVNSLQEIEEELKRKIMAHSDVDPEQPVEISKKGTELSVSFYCLETRLIEFNLIKRHFYDHITQTYGH